MKNEYESNKSVNEVFYTKPSAKKTSTREKLFFVGGGGGSVALNKD